MAPTNASAGYSGTPLPKKLGIKDGFRVAIINPPDNYRALISPIPPGVDFCGPRARSLDMVHCFVTSGSELKKRMPGMRRRIVQNGMIWVSWPKKSSGVVSDMTEDEVRRAAFANKLVDVKVCAVDEIWSGLKLMIRKKDRA